MPSAPPRSSARLLGLALAAAVAAGPAGPARADEPVPLPLPGADLDPAAHRDLTLPDYLGHAVGLRPLPLPSQRSDERFHWTLLPFVVLNPLMGAGGGAAAIVGARFGPAETTGFSSLEASGFLTARGQRGLAVRTDVRFPGDGWLLEGDLGAGTFPNPAWGLGGESPDGARTILHRSQVTVHEILYRRLAGRLYAGLGYAFDAFRELEADGPIPGAGGAPYPFGTSGRSTTSSLAFHLLWDGRDNPAAPTRGTYLMARFRGSHELLATGDAWRSLFVDGRAYLPVPGPDRRAVLALWAVAWSAFGQPPYLLLPSMGADPDHRTARGYVEGRYTGKDLLYAEAEYRFHVWQFVSGAVAVNATTVSDRGPEGPTVHFEHVRPAVVVGVRTLLSSASQARLAFDVAWAPGQPVAFYLAANEAF